MAKAGGLGKGLGALLSEAALDETEDVNDVEKSSNAGGNGGDFLLDLDKLQPNPHQPRTEFDPVALQDMLAQKVPTVSISRTVPLANSLDDLENALVPTGETSARNTKAEHDHPVLRPCEAVFISASWLRPCPQDYRSCRA